MTRWAWALVLVVTLGVWAPALAYDWLKTWDDAVFILGNPHVADWSWVWMATTQWYGHWMPLTWLSFCLNYALAGFHPMSWHAVNIALHALSAVLLYAIARRLIGAVGGAVAAALVFSIHPLRMESVAWITERKDVLMGAFFLASALLWLHNRRWWSFAAFVAACAAKSPAVVLPVMLLALDWYRFRISPVRYWRGYARALWPFIAVSIGVTAMAFWSLHTVLASTPWAAVPLGPRLLHMAYSEVFYAMQTFWPARLSGLIEYTWAPSWNQPQYPISVALVLIAAVLLVRYRHRCPALVAAAIAYTVAVLPQAGLFHNGPQLVANRYSYLACLPIALLAGGAFTMASRRWPRITVCCATAIVAALTTVTLVNLPMWKDGDAFWRYAALHEPTCTQCQDMAMAADVRDGDLASAIRHQEQAVRVSDTTFMPRFERHFNLGALLVGVGRYDDAAKEFHTYLDNVPPDLRDVPANRTHMERARSALARLERR